MRALILALGLGLAVTGTGTAGADEIPILSAVDWSGTLEVRAEAFDTPSPDSMRVAKYGMTHVRLRAFADWQDDLWGVHAGVMGAFSGGLRDDLAFAIGPVYAGANPGQTLPGRIYFLEGSVAVSPGALVAEVGRMKYADGAETGIGIAYLDGVKKARLQERLVGNWDWTVLGRRFDGAKAGFGNKSLHAHAYFLKPLQGGVNYGTGYRWFDDLNLAGGSLTLRHGVIPATELRGFVQYYDDSRADALASLGSPELKITTLGLQALVGNESSDAFLWVVKQVGTWGDTDQDALALIVEAGHKFGGKRAPTVRAGFARASGQDDSDKHKSFFNVMPTNHKFYGMLDYNAFSNLQTVYAHVGTNVVGRLSLKVAGHMFWLVEEGDAWYGGSGPFNDKLLGYAGRRPQGGGDFSSTDLGQEIDFTAVWKVGGGTTLSGGAGWFFGDTAAGEVLTVESHGFWGFLRAVHAF